jgi:hypothetical protein
MKPKRLISLVTLARIARSAPKEIADMAEREITRQIDTFGLQRETLPETEKLRDWLKSQKTAVAR